MSSGRGVINGKALPKFSYTLTLSQLGGGASYAHPLALPCLNKYCDYTPSGIDTVFQRAVLEFSPM